MVTVDGFVPLPGRVRERPELTAPGRRPAEAEDRDVGRPRPLLDRSRLRPNERKCHAMIESAEHGAAKRLDVAVADRSAVDDPDGGPAQQPGQRPPARVVEGHHHLAARQDEVEPARVCGVEHRRVGRGDGPERLALGLGVHQYQFGSSERRRRGGPEARSPRRAASPPCSCRNRSRRRRGCGARSAAQKGRARTSDACRGPRFRRSGIQRPGSLSVWRALHTLRLAPTCHQTRGPMSIVRAALRRCQRQRRVRHGRRRRRHPGSGGSGPLPGRTVLDPLRQAVTRPRRVQPASSPLRRAHPGSGWR